MAHMKCSLPGGRGRLRSRSRRHQRTTASATPAFSLRVEAPGTTIDPGTYYAPRSPVNAQRGELAGSGNCVRASGDIPLAGQTALGLVASAANANGALGPLLVAEDAFGRRVCRIGVFNETDTPFTGWLYRVNHVAPSLSGELAGLTRTDEVLWVFANFGSGENTGDELVLSAPLQNAPGHDPGDGEGGHVRRERHERTRRNSGDRRDDAGDDGRRRCHRLARLGIRDASGNRAGSRRRPRSRRTSCASARSPTPRTARPAPGRTIVGTDLRDKFKGTGGPDTIRSRGGNDRVIVRGGGIDLVKCGKGKDVAVGDSTDRLRGCEKARTGS